MDDVNSQFGDDHLVSRKHTQSEYYIFALYTARDIWFYVLATPLAAPLTLSLPNIYI